jgi:hypothetical protein
MTFKTLAVAATTAVVLSGCATQTFTINGDANGAADLSTRSYFFVGGIGQTDMIEAGDLCGGIENVAAVQAEYDPIDIIANGVTNGLFSPRSYKVFCVE